ncbi:hypothetical protein RB601_007271 [Gaeumannomyces tritici]
MGYFPFINSAPSHRAIASTSNLTDLNRSDHLCLAMQWKISIVPRDTKGDEFYLGSYKPFRLESLRLDPQAFGSTLARESAFDDSQWLQRLHNPAATTFVASSEEDDDDDGKQVLSSLTLFRMLDPDPDPDPDPHRQVAEAHWAVNAVWTRPGARRRGLAAAVLADAVRWARDAAGPSSRCCCVLTAHVYETNGAALALYEAAGFRRVAAGRQEEEEEEGVGEGDGRPAVCVLRLEMGAGGDGGGGGGGGGVSTA